MAHKNLVLLIDNEIDSYNGHVEVCKEWIALRVILELHQPKKVYRGSTIGYEMACYECKELPNYPCNTVKAIEKTLI